MSQNRHDTDHGRREGEGRTRPASDPDHFPDAQELARGHSSQTKPDVSNPYTLGDPANPAGRQAPVDDEWTGEGNAVPHGFAPQADAGTGNPYASGDPANPLGNQAPVNREAVGVGRKGSPQAPPQTHTDSTNPYAAGDPANPLGKRKRVDEGVHPEATGSQGGAPARFRLLTLPIALAGGLFGVLAAIHEQTFGGHALAVYVAGPVIEECVKPMGVIWLLEYRPRWLSASWQVVLLAALGGLVFAVIENLVYIHVYVPDGSASFQTFRWTVCTALHVGCCTIFGLGLARNWRAIIARGGGFQIDAALGTFVAAASIHGLYNVSVTALQATGVLVFD